MEYASLMVYVDDIESADARIELACDLADLFGSGLIGVSGDVPDTVAIDPYTGASIPADAWTEEERNAADRVKRAEAHFRSVVGARRSNMAWRGAVDYPAQLLAREARAADLIIVGREAAQNAPRHAAGPGDVLMAAGRPVLVAPPDLPKGNILGHVIVAWRDGRESRRAVADALPLLRKAEKITVLGISEFTEEEEANRHSVNDVANYIRLHGADATALALPAGDKASDERLLECARTNHAGLIVLGAYGHARLREWAFGGVTRSMLKTSPICCLFSH